MPDALPRLPHVATTMPATARLQFRCSHAQAQRARKRAARESVSLSVLLRAVFVDWLDGRHPTTGVLRSMEQNREELRAIGVNLNQIARRLNAGERPGRITPLVETLAAQVKDMHDLLTAYHVPRKP